MPIITRVVFVGLLALALAACGAAAPATTAAPTPAEPATVTPAAPTLAPPTPAPGEAAAVAPVTLPAWASLPLVDATSGAPFTLADYAGQTVYVHLMATWCSECLASQRRLRDEIIPQIGDQNIVFVSLDVQTQLANTTLASYATNNTFTWPFAVASQDFMNAIVADFGRSASNPPSRPHFVIYPDGSTSGLLTGRMTTQEEIDVITGTHGVGG